MSDLAAHRGQRVVLSSLIRELVVAAGAGTEGGGIDSTMMKEVGRRE